MLRHQIICAFRNLRRHKILNAVNLAGLSIALIFGLFLSLNIYEQNAYDKAFKDSEYIYRVNADFTIDDGRNVYSNAPRPVVPNLVAELPQLSHGLRVSGFGGIDSHTATLQYKDQRIQSKSMFLADSTFFDFFDYPIISKSMDNPLSVPNTMAISKDFAIKLFGDENPINKEVKLLGGSNITFKITAVYDKSDIRTHLIVDAVASYLTFYGDWELTQWYGAHVFSYVKLNPNSHISSVEAEMDAFYEKYMKSTFEPINGQAKLIFQPLESIHLDDELIWEPYPHGNRLNVQILIIVVILLLIFSMINYTNLTLASASERLISMGVRRVLGSEKSWIMAQFVIESLIISFMALLLALALNIFCLPVYESLTGLNVSRALLNSPIVILILISAALVIGLISGIYPAIYVSKMKVKSLLHSDSTGKGSAYSLRKLLVLIQYTLAAFLISSVVIVWQQVDFIKNRALGYNPENVLLVEIQNDSSVINHIDEFQEALKQAPQVASSSVISFSMSGSSNEFAPTLELPDGSQREIAAELIEIDEDFLETMELELVQGTNLSWNKKSETGDILINEALLRKNKWIEDPLNTQLKLDWMEDEEGNTPGLRIAGVVKDFYVGKNFKIIEPMILLPKRYSFGRTLAIKMTDDLNPQLVETKWKEIFPDHSFEYHFLKDDLIKQYKAQKSFFGQLTLYSVLLIIISSLGIIGMISFSIKAKEKEIAVRKILGSNWTNLIKILTGEFAILILLANIIALPMNYFFALSWLGNFAYSISYNILPAVIAIGICISFTVLALFYHMNRVRISNPVKFLRQE